MLLSPADRQWQAVLLATASLCEGKCPGAAVSCGPSVAGSITSDCQFMRGKMATGMNVLKEHSDFLRLTNCKSLNTAKGNEINNCIF